MRRIVFMVGGPQFHPVAAQAGMIAQWLGEGYAHVLAPGYEAMRHLEDANLLAVMGLYWPGMDQAWAGSMRDEMLAADNERRLEAFVRSGRPVISHHGGMASYPESAVFGDACGWAWVWGESTHSPLGEWRVRRLPSDHPVVEGVSDFVLEDEIYYRIKVLDPERTLVHAVADFDDAAHPMVSTRDRRGNLGRRVYLANGHDLRAFSGELVGPGGSMRTLWLNAVRWAMDSA